MILSTPTLLAGLTVLARVTNGFLLPTSDSPVDGEIIKSISFEDATQLAERKVNLQCIGCPVPASDESGNTVWLSGVENELQFTFNIVNHGNDVLTLNGLQLYPPHDLSSQPLTAPQITADGSKELVLGYELRVQPVAKSEDQQIEVISIDLQVVEIADKFVNGLDDVELNLLRLPGGQLLLGSLSLQPTHNPTINPSENGEQCSTLICKWRAIVSDRLSQLRSASGCGAKGHSKHAGHRSHGHHGHHRHHHKHMRIARFFFALKTVAVHVLIPVFIGVAVGMTASLVGMLVGNFVIFLWRTLYRRGQRGTYSKLQQSEMDDPAVTGQEKSIVGGQEPPPLYQTVVDEKLEL